MKSLFMAVDKLEGYVLADLKTQMEAAKSAAIANALKEIEQKFDKLLEGCVGKLRITRAYDETSILVTIALSETKLILESGDETK